MAKGQCIKVSDAPDNIADWRMKYNFSTNAVDVFGTESITDDEATAKQLTDEAELPKPLLDRLQNVIGDQVERKLLSRIPKVLSRL